MNNISKWIIIVSGVIVAIIVALVGLWWIKNNYSTINQNASSCGISDLTCQKTYDIESGSSATKTTYCTNLTKCKLVDASSSSSDYDISGYDISSIMDNIETMASIGCFNFTLDDTQYQICCKGSIGICASLQLLLLYKGYNVYAGASVVFNTTLCRALPSCFALNDSSPYILAPVPSFGPILFAYTKDDNNSGDTSVYRYPECGVDAQASGLPTLVSSVFGALGAMLISNYQSILYFIKFPKYSLLKYFSITPYLFQSARYGDNYSGDVIFASLTDSFNIQDLWNQLTTAQQTVWQSEGLDVIILMSHNKDQVLDVYEYIQNILNNDNIPDAIKNSSIWQDITSLPVFCLPLPAGSTYGNTRDPLGRKMLKKYRTNKYINHKTKIYDPNQDSIGMLFRIVPEDEDDPDYLSWKDDVSLQKNVIALGIEKCDASYTAFKLSDQNGKFISSTDNNGNTSYSWKPAKDRSDEGLQVSGSGFKKQSDYVDTYSDSTQNDASVSYAVSKITDEMKDYGYDYVREVTEIHGVPSPFIAYNDYITSKTSNTKVQRWSQYGADLVQFNIALFGDCRDTIYPSSAAFCLGAYDVGVIISQNYENRGTDTAKVLYNSLNVYDTASSTSFGSFKGPSDSLVYSMAFSRQDLTCDGNISKTINDFSFIPTGSHTNLAAAEDTTIYVLSRSYLLTDPTNGGFYTSPNPYSVPNYKLLIFSPCNDKKQKPAVCNVQVDAVSASPSSPSYTICEDNTSGDICDDLRITAQDKEDTTDSATGGLCNYLRNPKSTDKSTTLMYALVFMVLALCMIIACILFAVYLKNSRIIVYALIPITVVFIALAAVLLIQRNTISNTTANSYGNARDSM